MEEGAGFTVDCSLAPEPLARQKFDSRKCCLRNNPGSDGEPRQETS